MIPKLVQQLTYWPIYLVLKAFLLSGRRPREFERLEDKPVIFVSNHASYLDGPVCAAAMPRNSVVPHKFFPIRFLVVQEYFNYWKNSFPFPVSFLWPPMSGQTALFWLSGAWAISRKTWPKPLKP